MRNRAFQEITLLVSSTITSVGIPETVNKQNSVIDVNSHPELTHMLGKCTPTDISDFSI